MDLGDPHKCSQEVICLSVLPLILLSFLPPSLQLSLLLSLPSLLLPSLPASQFWFPQVFLSASFPPSSSLFPSFLCFDLLFIPFVLLLSSGILHRESNVLYLSALSTPLKPGPQHNPTVWEITARIGLRWSILVGETTDYGRERGEQSSSSGWFWVKTKVVVRQERCHDDWFQCQWPINQTH